jgi:hypothetical protein
MNDNVNSRMILTTAVFAALAALLVGPAAAHAVDEGSDAGRTSVTAPPTIQPGMIPYLSHGVGVDESRFSGQPSVGLTGDTAAKVDRAIAAADEAYDTWRVKTAIAARQTLFMGQQPSVGLAGDSALTRSPGTVTPPAASSANDDLDWSSFGLGVGMTALLAAGIAGVVLTTRRRGRIALP